MIQANQTIIKSLTISNLATGGAIGLAADTVDIGSAFSINQTTAGQTLSLPNPTIAADPRQVVVINIGTVPFSMHGQTIANGAAAGFTWTGTAWVPNSSSVGTTVTTVTADPAYTTWNRTIEGNATGGSFNVTLPTAVGNAGFLIEVKKTDSSSNTVTVLPNGSETIDGANGYALSQQNDSVILRSNGTNVDIVAVYTPTALSETITAAGTTNIVSTQRVILMNGGASQVANLPDATTIPNVTFLIKKINASTISTTISATAGTFDGSATLTLSSQYDDVLVRSDGTNYQIVARYSAVYSGTTADKIITNALSPYTLLETDEVININTAGGNVTINLPASLPNNKRFYFNTLGTANTVTLTPAGATIVDPLTLVAGASTTIPTGVGLYSSMVYYKSNGVWQVT